MRRIFSFHAPEARASRATIRRLPTRSQEPRHADRIHPPHIPCQHGRLRRAAPVFRPRRRRSGSSAGDGNDRPACACLPVRLLRRPSGRHGGTEPRGELREGDPGRGDQLHAAGQRRLSARQPHGRLHRLRTGHEGRRHASDHHGDEHRRVRRIDAWQPRIQLRPRFPAKVPRRCRLSGCLRECGKIARRLAHRGRNPAPALRDPGSDADRRRRRDASNPGRPHRLRPPADHELGPSPPRRQRPDPLRPMYRR